MDKKDLKAALIIGGAVGLLVQPILANIISSGLSASERLGIFFFFLILGPLALWIFSLIEKVWKGVYQFAKFAAVGTLNSFIDLGVLNLETFLYGSPVIGAVLFAVFKAISFLFATTNSFFWNKYWTFSVQQKPEGREVTSFYTVAFIGWVLNVGVATLVKSAGPAESKVWTDLVAPLAGVAASFIWDFVGFKYFVFKKKLVPQAE